MANRWRIVVPCLLALLLPSFAAADEDYDQTTQYSHQGQFGLHLSGGTGFRFISPYDGQYCGQLSENNGGNKSTCTGRVPGYLDLGFTFGATQGMEVVLEIRVGLEDDFGGSPSASGPKVSAFAPGVRLYHRDAGLLKFFSSFQFIVDQTDYHADQPSLAKTDYGVRNTNGLQIDFHRTFGAFAFFGVAVTGKRWLHFELDGGIGIQVRVP